MYVCTICEVGTVHLYGWMQVYSMVYIIIIIINYLCIYSLCNALCNSNICVCLLCSGHSQLGRLK